MAQDAPPAAYPPTTPTPGFYRVDTFDVPAAGRDEFLGRIAATHAVLRVQPGFVRDVGRAMDDVVREDLSLTVAPSGGGTDGVMGAYLARPRTPGAYPGVVVGMEIFGVTPYVRAAADRIARLGYVALAPDFYHRTAPGVQLARDADGRRDGLALMQRLTRAEVVRDAAAALAALRTRTPAGARLGMVGFSLGGHIAYLAATQLDLTATAVVYGGWLPTTDVPLSRPEPTLALTPGIARHDGAVLVLGGGRDALIPAEQRAMIADALRAAGVRHEMVVYPDAPHGFCCEEADTFDPAASADAWGRIHQLLTDELGPSSPDRVRRLPDAAP